MDAASIALTGLTAQKQRLAGAASNIANAVTTGRLPTADNPATTVYKPLDVSLTALTVGSAPGGVQAQVRVDETGYTPVYAPNSPFADDRGLIAAPNVDLATEIIDIIEIKAAYKASLAVIRAQDELDHALLDVLS